MSLVFGLQQCPHCQKSLPWIANCVCDGQLQENKEIRERRNRKTKEESMQLKRSWPVSDKPREWTLCYGEYNDPAWNGPIFDGHVDVVEIEAFRKFESERNLLKQKLENADIIIRTLEADVKFWKNKAGEKE